MNDCLTTMSMRLLLFSAVFAFFTTKWPCFATASGNLLIGPNQGGNKVQGGDAGFNTGKGEKLGSN